ncbi:DEAD/DEAH box helicase [Amphibacillus sp. MSJ-3]|uniref:SNF2-related protein n=1 Tax=Amphibacillus sp. MSJ-3 TaxID=2841505 RepID=UPI001C0F1949|nr:DEAD/DEAH box helicase [Amphibacillus sp. MSJ-3]
MTDFIPHDYQDYSIKKIIENPAAGLFLDMGMGKTVSTLTAVADLMYDYFEVNRVLVIAPLRVAKYTWTDEIEKWEHLNHLRTSQILGTKKQRLAALDKQADIYLINRENVVWLVDHLKSDWPFDMVVIDELSSFKSTKAKRFRALRKVRPLIKRIVGLTGTPAPNGLIDLWPQLYLLDQGERLGTTITGFRNRYFVPGAGDPSKHVVYEWVPKPEAEENIYKKIGDICVSMKSVDHLKIPERVDHVVEVNLGPRTRRKYEQLEKDFLLSFEDSDVVADTAAVLSNKLLQLSNGAIYDENKDVQHIHDEKLDALEELIEQANGKPVLVFYNFKHDLARIQARFKEAVKLETDADFKAWNKGEIPILLTHPASAGHGLNMQDGGNTIIWFGLNWSLELYQQANARLHRQGQKNIVNIYHLIVTDSIDEKVMKAIKNKTVTQDNLMQAVKARLDRYKGVEA